MAIFRRANFSITSSALKGAGIGGSVAAIISQFLPDKLHDPRIKLKGDLLKLAAVGTGVLLGGVLGAIGEVVTKISDKVSSRKAYNRILDSVVKQLKKERGYREGIDFTRDPKKSSDLKIKVCMVISTFSQELRILINTAADPKLDSDCKKIVKSFVDESVNKINVKENKAADKFNEISLITISDVLSDSEMVVELTSRFIDKGYPVYLIEVG